MTAKLTDVNDADYQIQIGLTDEGAARVRVECFPYHIEADVPRADFLAAVSSELGVTVIDKATFPPVEACSADADLCGIGTFSKSSDPEALEREGARYFAYAAYLRANPPVDETQVGALTSIIDELGPWWAGMTESDLARRLIATGRVEVQP